MIAIRVNMREARAIRAASLRLASEHYPLTEGVSPWDTYRRVIREAASMVQFQVDPDEERELTQRGATVKQGMAFIDPQTAMSMMTTMANDQSAFKDVPTITSVVRKMASKLGQPMPKVAAPEPTAGKPGDPTDVQDRPSDAPGAAKARQTEVPTASLPGYQSQAQLKKMQQNIPYLKDPSVPQIELPQELKPDPSKPGQFIPQTSTHQQDVAAMRGSGKPRTNVQDPSQQERTSGMEDPEGWFKEAKSLLNRSPWGLMEEDEDVR